MEPPLMQNTKCVSNVESPHWCEAAASMKKSLALSFQSIWGPGGAPAPPHHTAPWLEPHLPITGLSSEHPNHSSNITSKAEQPPAIWGLAGKTPCCFFSPKKSYQVLKGFWPCKATIQQTQLSTWCTASPIPMDTMISTKGSKKITHRGNKSEGYLPLFFWKRWTYYRQLKQTFGSCPEILACQQ